MALLEQSLWIIAALTLGLMLLKATVLLVLAMIFKVHASDRWLFTLSLAQAGEFGFVLLSYAVSQHVIPSELAQLLSMVVALSMFLTPALFILFEKVIQPRYQKREDAGAADSIDDTGTVIIAGIGRFGQIVNRILVANDVPVVVLDYKASQVDRLRAINIKSYYGDASQPDLLHTAGIDQARLFVVAIDDKTRSVELVKHIKHAHTHVQVLARAYDRGHLYELKDAGADYVISETYQSALALGGEALQRLGMHAFRVEQIKQQFSSAEREHFDELFHSWRSEGDDIGFGEHYMKLFMEIEEELLNRMQSDPSDRHSKSERGWTPPPKHYAEDFE